MMKRVPIIYEGIEVGYSYVEWNPETQEITIISSVVTDSEIPEFQERKNPLIKPGDHSIPPAQSD